MSSVLAPAVRRVGVRVSGVVQGVGFRPFVYRLARELGLSGFVLNDTHGVLAEAEGGATAVETFLARLGPDAPPLAVVHSLAVTDLIVIGDAGFAIRESAAAGMADAPVAADSATCADCRHELLDPDDRRYRYPFVNCTNCGPRFTIVRGVPYDRPLTSMASFTMCPACQAEYDDPSDRRFHAQPNACPMCGPAVSLVPDVVGRGDVMDRASAALAAGEILAVKGIGGYHLACRGDDERVVARLRARKHREDKPFALMVPSAGAAAALVSLSAQERELLASPARPIVLAARRPGAVVARSVAPGARELGVMLPYSPLHHLLMSDLARLAVDAVVLTSGNVSDEPIAFADADARERLADVADRFLVHNRPIETRTDDSVMRVIEGGGGPRRQMIRRSRGHVPAALALPGGTPRPLLGCGAELKHTFCVARGERAWVSHHIGDLRNYETLRSFRDGVRHFERLFAVTPEVVAHDLHPEYLSTKEALGHDGVETIGVQHHHAHLAACLAEFGEPGPAVGAIFDGTGYGTDGTVWGGEFLCGDLTGFRRVGHLLSARLPGGERAIRQPWRMACAWLSQVVDGPPERPRVLAEVVDEATWTAVAGLVATGLSAPATSSMGRLFDAAAALCGVCPVVRYEGQAAIEFEALCAPGSGCNPYPMPLREGADGFVLDPLDAIRGMVADVAASVPVGVVAGRFHAAVAAGTVAACERACEETGSGTVVLSGGVFGNRRLLEAVLDGLQAVGLRVLVPELLPAGDGAIAFGQVAVAAAALRASA
jgi:hydrogenase maturation protein HypF